MLRTSQCSLRALSLGFPRLHADPRASSLVAQVAFPYAIDDSIRSPDPPNFLYPIATVRFSFRIKLLAQVVLASLFGKPSAKQTNTDEASLQHIVKPERNNPRVISWALAWPKARVCGLALHVSDAVSLGFGNY